MTDTKIELGKQYKTRDGAPVKLHYVDEAFAFGYVAGGAAAIWMASNGEVISQLADRGDLIEVKPQITRTYWLAIFGDRMAGQMQVWGEDPRGKLLNECIAITGPHTVTFTEGDGL